MTRLSDDQVRLVFQPILHVQTGRVVAHEALSRPTSASPSATITELLDSARRDGDLWNLEESIRELVLFQLAHAQIIDHVFINCSPCVIEDERFTDSLQAAIDRHRIDPARVTLEVTESRAHEEHDVLLHRLGPLRERGVSVALDDVGTGGSGLGRMLSLDPDWLKLDRSLVTHIDRDPSKQSVVRFLLQFGERSNARVVAEGVETETELQTLVDLGIRYAQGYLLGAPHPDGAVSVPDTQRCIDRVWRRRRSAGQVAPTHSPIAALSEGAPTMAHRTTIHAAAEAMLPLAAEGLVATDGGRPIAWLPRETLMAHARSGRAHEPIAGSLREQAVLPAETSLANTLEIASRRHSSVAHHPLLLEREGRFVGVVAVSSLLAAASELMGATISQAA
ncbi:MAG: EAL domain-containing protein [Planctomycetota bacterium]